LRLGQKLARRHRARHHCALALARRDHIVDLKSEAGLEIIRRLIDRSDLMIANFSVGTLERIGIGWAAAHARNPRLIVVEMPAYGANGPISDHVALGPSMELMSGMARLIGYGEPPNRAPERAGELLARLEDNVHRVIVGKDATVRLAVTGLVAGGHVLLQDLPGTGKTMLARALATSIEGSFRRIQCTPDLLPADITGASVFNQRDLTFEFLPGPVFANIVLADEINRATPRTQSALLEAMGEGQVTVEGTTHVLDKPFSVVATQNPAEFQGTYPLPESQLDRFLLAAEMGAPTTAEALEVLARREHGDPFQDLRPVLQLVEILELQAACLRVVVAPAIRSYVVSLLEAIRSRQEVLLPASMRAAVYLQRAAQGWALFDGRDFVLPDDVKALAVPVLSHRLALRGRLRGEDLIAEIVEQVPLPPLRST